jgi:Mg2+/citrate symporter
MELKEKIIAGHVNYKPKERMVRFQDAFSHYIHVAVVAFGAGVIVGMLLNPIIMEIPWS